MNPIWNRKELNLGRPKREPDARTIGEATKGVREWKNHEKSTCKPYTISRRHPKSKLHGALVYVIGPPKSAIKAAKTLNRILIIKNKTLMVRIKLIKTKSKFYKEEQLIEIKPSLLIEIF